MQFEMLKDKSSIIKVIGVGGGGGNAVNHMYLSGITGVDFIICNTDAQALESSPIPNKVQLGASLTEGMGAGSIPEVGKNSAIENIDDIKAMLGSTTKMLFITAGMGGGTGTGASPIIAKAAKELDILTVAIITTPFSFEGKRRRLQADEGMEELKKYVDSYLVISNDRLREIFGNLTLGSAFGQADDILTTAAKGIAEIITVPGYINVDFKDVRTVMKDSGVAIMGSFAAEGDDRALQAVEGALASPLLKDNEIEGARYILLNISSGLREVTMDEVSIITDYIQEKAGLSADLIWGNCTDESLSDKLSVTIIATGFQTSEERVNEEKNKKKISLLTPEEAPLVRPVEPVNSFIQPKTTPSYEPVLKTKEEVSQADLFGGMFNKSEPQKVQEPENNVVRHTLIEEEPQVEEAKETGFEFEVKLAETNFVFETPVAQMPPMPEPEPEIEMPVVGLDDDKSDESMEEQLKKSKERILRLKDLSMKLRTTNGLQELENEPAYKRKQMQLQQVQHSSESQVSRFTLSNDQDGGTEIRPNNSFLHDNVD
ncbi:cell division protein FtsZ [Pedobacter riviphilus]|uniref:Cell division protein FtsZ n=1 Tax=Pedobacter riviphilus TaxID=2766984 RepID=A0ABX6TJF4_9SPHI|nr:MULTISPECIES: cell division protein FtsZ [Pedobacter]MBB6235448.1 cell division protein FtsZ [Pedobacter sp. AK013]NII81377.1 cell division protein FtsZ [Pedobacter sp. SG908]NMN35383.1 cell division protein FtsZ [Pedobacter sp. SG918]QNR85341.1 cell division protein FtsZ [Pedobacter riviphilus]